MTDERAYAQDEEVDTACEGRRALQRDGAILGEPSGPRFATGREAIDVRGVIRTPLQGRDDE